MNIQNKSMLFYSIMIIGSRNNRTTKVELDNFQLTANESCAHPLQYAIFLLLFQNNTNISFIINNTNFNNLMNVSAMYYYGESCGMFASNNLMFTNCTILRNTGYSGFSMFKMILYNQGCFDTVLLKQYYNQQFNNISFTNYNLLLIMTYNHNDTCNTG